jgi:hypothetical protein
MSDESGAVVGRTQLDVTLRRVGREAIVHRGLGLMADTP